jgi:hypothetical protein
MNAAVTTGYCHVINCVVDNFCQRARDRPRDRRVPRFCPGDGLYGNVECHYRVSSKGLRNPDCSTASNFK